MARIIREIRPRHVFVENSPVLTSRGPRHVFVENSPVLTSRGLHRVLGDLAEMGFDARWGVLGAHHAGAPHKRDRIWILASYADRYSKPAQPVDDEASRVSSVESPDPSGDRLEGQQQGGTETGPTNGPGDGSHPSWWEVEPDVGRVADGVASRVDRLQALGNGQVPAVACLAWQALND
jgi:DNA (cytosine-5)-methyltransferase 1